MVSTNRERELSGVVCDSRDVVPAASGLLSHHSRCLSTAHLLPPGLPACLATFVQAASFCCRLLTSSTWVTPFTGHRVLSPLTAYDTWKDTGNINYSTRIKASRLAVWWRSWSLAVGEDDLASRGSATMGTGCLTCRQARYSTDTAGHGHTDLAMFRSVIDFFTRFDCNDTPQACGTGLLLYGTRPLTNKACSNFSKYCGKNNLEIVHNAFYC